MPNTLITPGPTRPSLLLAAGSLLLVAIYFLLCIGDYLVARSIDRQAERLNPEARRIEAERVVRQDAPQMAQAMSQGYRPLLFPALFEQPGFRDLALEAGVVPLAAQPLTRLMFCNEGGGLVRYYSDRFGMRNADSVWDVPVIDVALVGDSYVHGACVEDADTLVSRLQTPGRRVVNLGTSGNNAIHYAAVLKAFLPALRPRYAVLVLYPNDNEDERDSLFRPLTIDASPAYVQLLDGKRLPGQIYQRLGPLFARAEALALWQRQRADSGTADLRFVLDRTGRYLALRHLRQLAGLAWRRLVDPDLAWSSQLAIDTLAAQCAPPQCQPVLAYIPNSAFWRPDFRAPGYRAALKAYAEASHPAMRWLDTGPGLEALDVAAYAHQGPHLSAAGYAVVAEQITRALDP